MKVLIVTVAGTARRFNRELERETAKCIFYRENPQNALLYQLCVKAEACDTIIIVGGYHYTEVCLFVERYIQQMPNRLHNIEMVFNPNYESYGSAYSLILGIEAAKKLSPEEIIFAEGDLFFDKACFDTIIAAQKDTLSINTIPIQSEKAVVLYEDMHHHVRYLYDTAHKALRINEAFLAIYNSAQVWKFVDMERLFSVVKHLSEKQRMGTNLEIINAYFSEKTTEEIEIVVMKKWINCNTIYDYDDVLRNIISYAFSKNIGLPEGKEHENT
ncbi:MAG: hypothetical protein LBP19_09920 [Treponema sp.]|jgi:choline kinase|nr:hypothetical protein [Treponema sp.]